MLCPNCAAPINDTAKFCSNCGTSVAVSSSSPYAAATEAAEETSFPYQEQGQQQDQGEQTPFERGYQQGYAWASGEQPPQADPTQQSYQQTYQGQTYQQPASPYAYAVAGTPTKNKIAAGLLAIFLGALGIHKFYLGYTTQGIIMLLVSIFTFGIGAFVMEVIGIIEGILYLVKSDQEFYYTYEANQKPWF